MFSLLRSLFLIWIISTFTACNSFSPSTQPTLNPEELKVKIQSELKGELTHFIQDYRDHSGTVFVRWDLAGDSTNALIAKSAKEDTVTVLENFAASKQSFEEIIVSGWHYWTVDINGTLEYNEFFRLKYTTETLTNINWDTVRSDYIWLIADSGEIHWLLEK